MLQIDLGSLPSILAEDEHEAELVLGTNFDDDITTGGGPQHIIAGNGNDRVWAGGGPDIVELGNGNDEAWGGGGPDTLLGGNGSDYLNGGAGPDTIDGGNGKDVLVGGIAHDILTGGNGADLFVYESVNDAPGHGGGGGGEDDEAGGDGEDEGGGVETITDFQVGLDHMDFTALGLPLTFGDGPAEYGIWATAHADGALVKVETDGNLAGEHPEDMTILLLGVDAASLSSGDFLV